MARAWNGWDEMKAYHVTAWDRVHETAESRKYQRLSWFAKPNKHDGLGFRQVAREADRTDLYAAWNLILEVASKGPKGVRGWLVRDEVALTAWDLELMTGFEEKVFVRALEFFSQGTLGWLEMAEYPAAPAASPGITGGIPAAPAASPGITGGIPAAPAASPGLSPADNSTVQDSTKEGTENKKKGMAQQSTSNNQASEKDQGPSSKNQTEDEPPRGKTVALKNAGAVAASRTQWAALSARIKELEAQGPDLEEEERVELRKNRAALSRLQKEQAAGKF